MHAFLNTEQVPAFVLIFLAGFSTAALYEVGSLLFKTKHFMIRCLFDLFLVAVTVFISLIALYKSGESCIRLYMLFAFALGYCVFGCIIKGILRKTVKHFSEKRKSADNSE